MPRKAHQRAASGLREAPDDGAAEAAKSAKADAGGEDAQRVLVTEPGSEARVGTDASPGAGGSGRQRPDEGVAGQRTATAAASQKERDSLYLELEKLLKEQEAADHELQSLIRERDAETERADEAEAAVRAQCRAAEELQRRAHGLELRTETVADEEATWRQLVTSLAVQQTEDATAQARERSSRARELALLREELEVQQRLLLEHDFEAERRRRIAADERCMELQAMLDYVAGKLTISTEDLHQIIGGVVRPLGKVEEEQAHRLLERQRQGQREELRSLVALCNQELRRRSRSAWELIDDEGLPRLLSVLSQEGLVDVSHAANSGSLKPDAARTARIRKAMLRT